MSDAVPTTADPATTTTEVVDNYKQKVHVKLPKTDSEAALNKYIDDANYRNQVTGVSVHTKKNKNKKKEGEIADAFGFITFNTAENAAAFVAAYSSGSIPAKIDDVQLKASASKSKEEQQADSDKKKANRKPKAKAPKPEGEKKEETKPKTKPEGTNGEPVEKKEKKKGKKKAKEPKEPKPQEPKAPRAPKEPKEDSTDYVALKNMPETLTREILDDVLKAAGVVLPPAPTGKESIVMTFRTKKPYAKKKSKAKTAETDAPETKAEEAKPEEPVLVCKSVVKVYVGTPEKQEEVIKTLNGYVIPNLTNRGKPATIKAERGHKQPVAETPVEAK